MPVYIVDVPKRFNDLFFFAVVAVWYDCFSFRVDRDRALSLFNGPGFFFGGNLLLSLICVTNAVCHGLVGISFLLCRRAFSRPANPLTIGEPGDSRWSILTDLQDWPETVYENT